jgi:hypothetical protein
MGLMREDRNREKFCLYFLRDPRDGVVRYIGQTCRPSVRKSAHWSARLLPGGCHEKRKEWLLELESLSMRPVFQVAFGGLTFNQAVVAEARLVFLHAINSPGQLYQAFNGLSVCDAVKARVDLRSVPKPERKPPTHGVFSCQGRLVVAPLAIAS